MTLRLEFEPESAAEKAGDALKIVERQAAGDLQRFKEFIEDRGQETGAWRGQVQPSGDVEEQRSTTDTAPGESADQERHIPTV